MKNVGYVEDKLASPYVTIKYPDGRVYMKFLGKKESRYQSKRFYSDETIMTAEQFDKLCKSKYKVMV